MKIYPSNHSIKQAKRPLVSMIPLGHIDKELSIKRIIAEKDPAFAKDIADMVNPYDTFGTDDLVFFDENGDRKRIELKRQKAQFIYEPSALVEFTPDQFTAKALIKKQLQYNSKTSYNLKVAVDDIQRWSDLISIFGNAPDRGICPANITVNNKSTQAMSLINATIENLDFLFIDSPDGATTQSGDEIDFDKLMDAHTNIWLAIDENEKLFEQVDTSYKVQGSFQRLYKDGFTIDESYGAKIKDRAPKFPFPVSGYYISYPFDGRPIALLEKPNGAYLVISQKSLFKNLNAHVPFIYEVMMEIYLQSYMTSKAFSSWITDNPIDYIASIDRPMNRNHKDISLDDMIDCTDCNIDLYTVVKIDIDNSNVVFSHMDTDRHLFFIKMGGSIDPIKEYGDISVYTTKNTVIQYKTDIIKRIESNVQIDAKIDSVTQNCSILVRPFKSSKHKIIVPRSMEIKIPHPEKIYYLTALPIDKNGESTLNLIDRAEYISGGSVLIAQISVDYEAEEVCADVRIKGGGLPEKIEEDYDMLDIGNLYGKAYRVGATLIIKLPKRLKPYNDKIQQALNAYKNAADLIIIYFE